MQFYINRYLVCFGLWFPSLFWLLQPFNEYFDEFDCRTCLRSLATELDFDPKGFTVVAAMPDQCTRRNKLTWPAV